MFPSVMTDNKNKAVHLLPIVETLASFLEAKRFEEKTHSLYVKEHIKSATYYIEFITPPKHSGNIQKISERHVCIVTRALTISQGRRTVINLMTSNKNFTQICPSCSLDQPHFFTSRGSTKNRLEQNRTEYSKHSEFLSRHLPLFFPPEMTNVKLVNEHQ